MDAVARYNKERWEDLARARMAFSRPVDLSLSLQLYRALRVLLGALSSSGCEGKSFRHPRGGFFLLTRMRRRVYASASEFLLATHLTSHAFKLRR